MINSLLSQHYLKSNTRENLKKFTKKRLWDILSTFIWCILIMAVNLFFFKKKNKL